MNIILCEADTEHYCRECERDKSYCNYPGKDVRACSEFEGKEINEGENDQQIQ